MDKLKKKILFIFLISIILCSVQAIAAAEVDDAGLDDEVFDLSNDIETVEADNSDEVLQVSNEAVDDEVLAAPDSEDTLSDGEGNFTELQSLVNRVTAQDYIITLDKDYKYSPPERTTSGIVVSKRNIIIDGNGHTIDGAGTARLLSLSTAHSGFNTITLKNLKIINCNSTDGGAIIVGNRVNLHIQNCTFIGNNATNGGVIYSHETESSVYITGSTFTDNNAKGDGGAIYAYDCVINASNFTSNSANHGGALYKIGPGTYGTFNITGSNFINNSAETHGGVIFSNSSGSGSAYAHGSIIIKNSNLTTNNASTGNGGAIYIVGPSRDIAGTVTLVATNVSGNLAKGDSDGYGGAIYADSARVFAVDSFLTGNNATKGSAIYVTDKTAGKYFYFQLNNTVLLENQANSTSIVAATTGNTETGEGVKFDITFTGEDNLCNGIYAVPFTSTDNYYFNGLTYWDETGEATGTFNHSDAVNKLSTKEAGINITLNITDSKGNSVLYNKSTNATGQCTINWDDVIEELGLKRGVYTVTPIHIEDNYYTGIQADPITVFVPGSMEVIVSNESAEGKVGEAITVEFEVNDTDGNPVNGGHLTVTIDGKEYNSTDVQNGKATFDFGSFDKVLDLKDLEVDYNGTDEYCPSYGYLNLTITKYATVVSNVSASGKVTDSITVEFEVTTNESGVVVNGGHLTVVIDGKEYNSTDVQDGKATFTFDPFMKALDEKDLEVKYNGTNKFDDAVGHLNLTVRKLTVTVTVDKVIGYPGDTVKVYIHVVDEDGNNVTGGTVVYEIDYDSRRLNAGGDGTPVENGQAELDETLNGAPGLYDANVDYTGNDIYEDAKGKGEAEILKLNTTTSSEDVSGNVGDKKDIAAEILDQNGKAVQNGTATLTVDGKEYTADVKDGKAVFEGVELTKNTTATIKYEGNDWYNPSETTINLTVKEEQNPDEEPSDEPEDNPEEEPSDEPEDEPDEEPSDEPEEEPAKVPAKTVTAEKGLATGNPIAMLLMVLVALVSTISIRRQK